MYLQILPFQNSFSPTLKQRVLSQNQALETRFRKPYKKFKTIIQKQLKALLKIANVVLLVVFVFFSCGCEIAKKTQQTLKEKSYFNIMKTLWKIMNSVRGRVRKKSSEQPKKCWNHFGKYNHRSWSAVQSSSPVE